MTTLTRLDSSSSKHKLDSLCTFSDAFHTCRLSTGFERFQLLTPNIMLLAITLKMLNMPIKITPDTFSDRKMTLVMRFLNGIVLFPSGKCLGRTKQARTSEKTITAIARNLICSALRRMIIYHRGYVR